MKLLFRKVNKSNDFHRVQFFSKYPRAKLFVYSENFMLEMKRLKEKTGWTVQEQVKNKSYDKSNI